MSAARAVALGLGAASTAATLLLAADPDAVPAEAVVAAVGGEYPFVAAVGAVALALVLVAVAWRGVSGLDQATPPTPEEVQSAPLFGADFDDAVDEPFGLRARLRSDRPAALRERVRGAAVAVEAAAGCSRAEAERRVATGEWTADAEAAAFLSDERGPAPPPAARVGAALRGDAWFQRGARRAAEAVAERADSEGVR